MALGDFENLVTIAKGSFGVVYKAVRKDNGRFYALKQVNITNMNRAEREEAVDEARVLADVRRFVDAYVAMHPTSANRVRFLEYDSL